jgi:hypothetical protein
MDVQTRPRVTRIFSILNDNDCPSFVIRSSHSDERPSFTSESRRSSASSSLSPPAREERPRPSLVRYQKYGRESSIASADSPPELSRHSSASSKDSSSSMDSSPSPATPAYNFLDNNLLYHDPLVRQDIVGGYLPSPTTVTPFLEQQLMISNGITDPFMNKQMPPIIPNQYPIIPTPLQPNLQQSLPIPAPIAPIASAPVPPPVASVTTSAQASTSPASSTAAPATKKNKYPCPFAQSHNCLATFTTSGHAARHGKKHTGEKGVHCPICNKAFTRKDNMKQHERTHKGQNASGTTGEESTRRSKAAITKEAQAQKSKQLKKHDSTSTEESRRSSLIRSPLSEVTSAAPTAIDTPMNSEEPALYADPAQVLMPIHTVPASVSPSSYYPPLNEDAVLGAVPLDQALSPLKPIDPSLITLGLPTPVGPPPLIRGFSDLDTLAQAAESFDTSFYPSGLYTGTSTSP